MDEVAPRPSLWKEALTKEIRVSLPSKREFAGSSPAAGAYSNMWHAFCRVFGVQERVLHYCLPSFHPSKASLEGEGFCLSLFFFDRSRRVNAPPSVENHVVSIGEILSDPIRSEQPPNAIIDTANFTTIRDLLATPLSISPPNVKTVNPTFSPTAVYNDSLEIQRDIGLNTVLDIAYTGSLGRHSLQRLSLNAVPYGTRFQPSSIDPTVAGGTTPPIGAGSS
jgi:hypothetical protein